MSLIGGCIEAYARIRLVRTGPSLRQRLEWKMAGWHHRVGVARLTHFRHLLERDMAPESWVTLETPMVLCLSEVCDTLTLTEEERAGVLEPEGVRALADILETRVAEGRAIVPVPPMVHW